MVAQQFGVGWDTVCRKAKTAAKDGSFAKLFVQAAATSWDEYVLEWQEEE